MANEILSRDQNHITVLGGVTDDVNQFIKMFRIDPVTKRVLISAVLTTALGSLSDVTITSPTNGQVLTYENGIWVNMNAGGSGLTVGTTTIASGTSTRILYDNAGVLGEYTITGTGTVVAMATSPTFVTSINVAGVIIDASDINVSTNNPLTISTNNTNRWQFSSGGNFLALTDNTYDIGATGATRPRTIYVATSVIAPSFVGALTGNASTVTTNANLTGPITSVGNATSIASQTGTGTKFVVDTSPTLISPALGTPTALVATNVTGTAAGLTSGITNAIASATTTVNVSSATAPTSGQVLTATSGTAATWQSPGGTTVVTFVPLPNFPVGSPPATVSVATNTTAFCGQVFIPFTINANKVSIANGSKTTNGTYKVALFSADGQTQVFSFTTASVTTSNSQVITTLGAQTPISPGNYYIVILPVSTASSEFMFYQDNNTNGLSNTQGGGLAGGVTGKAILQGTITVTASTMPATITPTSITPVASACLVFRLDN